MNKINLTSLAISPHNGQKAQNLCIILHGYGADGYDLKDLATPLAPIFPSMHFLIPNAPQPCEINPQGYQWFSLLDRSEPAMYKGALEAEETLNKYIDYQLEYFDLTEENLVIMGFSQGTMLALHTMLRRKKACKMIIGFSGMMLGSLEQIKAGLKSTPNICLIHGREDNVVPFWAFEQSKDKLHNCNVEVKTKAIANLSHSIDYEGLNFAITELKKVLL